jgi:hypothetical protein
MIVGTLSSLGVLNWALNHISGICTSAAVNGFTCPYSSTHFNTSLIWGAVGPRRYFSNQIGYSALLYFFIIGAVLPIPVHLLSRRYPNSLWKKIHIPLFIGGLNYLPPATGMNYGSWAVVGLTFGWLIRKRLHGWWSKYNFVLSSAMDSSVGIAGVVIFLTIYFTGASEHFSWWGTEVYKVIVIFLKFEPLMLTGNRTPVTGKAARIYLSRRVGSLASKESLLPIDTGLSFGCEFLISQKAEYGNNVLACQHSGHSGDFIVRLVIHQRSDHSLAPDVEPSSRRIY